LKELTTFSGLSFFSCSIISEVLFTEDFWLHKSGSEECEFTSLFAAQALTAFTQSFIDFDF